MKVLHSAVAIALLFASDRGISAEVRTTRPEDRVEKTETLGIPPASAGTAELVQYGRFLFNSMLLSKNQAVSCASCHDASEAYSGPTPLTRGLNGEPAHRHAPTLVNVSEAELLMWDGRAQTLESQVLIPLQGATEMAIDWKQSLQMLARATETSRFLASQHSSTLTKSVVLKSICAFVRSLVANDSPFDRYYYRGDESAISQDAKDGLMIFVRKGQCATCHLMTGRSAPFTDASFHSVGVGFLNGLYSDRGRYSVTHRATDIGAFKTPTLRDVSQRKYFMHDGSMSSLEEVIAYYNRGGNKGALNLDARIRPLFFTGKDVERLKAFLATLNSPMQESVPASPKQLALSK